MLTSLISWLSKRFPEKLELTLIEYKEMREEMGQYNLAFQGLNQLNDRVVQLEAQIKRLNDANGFVNVKKGQLNLER